MKWMNMKNIAIIIIGVIVACIWGYTELTNGEMTSFILRLMFIPTFALLVENKVKPKLLRRFSN